jgi:hypothetical protein
VEVAGMNAKAIKEDATLTVMGTPIENQTKKVERIK